MMTHVNVHAICPSLEYRLSEDATTLQAVTRVFSSTRAGVSCFGGSEVRGYVANTL